jgi:hypothetical protein
LEEGRAESNEKHIAANVKYEVVRKSFEMKEENGKWEGNIIIEQ